MSSQFYSGSEDGNAPRHFLIQHRNLIQKILKHTILCLFAKRFDVNIVHIDFFMNSFKEKSNSIPVTYIIATQLILIGTNPNLYL